MPSQLSAKHLALHGLAYIAATAILLGCGASGDTTGPGTSATSAGPPTSIVLTSSGPSSGPFGATLRSPFQAKVTDASGRGVAGVTVTFSIDSGAVVSPSVTTDSLGIAETRVRLSMTRGTVTLRATTGTVQTSTTVTVTGVTFASLSLGGQATCGLSVEGYGYCWGRPYGAVSIASDSINVPVPMVGANVLQSVSERGNAGCGITSDSTGVCWGAIPAAATSPAGYIPPTPVPGKLKFRSLSRGAYGACGVTVMGAVDCWGWNYTGLVGSNTMALDAYTPDPLPVDLPGSFASVYVGNFHACALSTAGQAYCWGQNVAARAVDANGDSVACTGLIVPACATRPAVVPTSLRFSSLAIGSNSTCGLATDGQTYCWGRNESGELGTGDTLSIATPRQVSTTVAFTQISGGNRAFCGLTSAGAIYCWGSLTTVFGIPGGTCPLSGWDCDPTPTQVSPATLHFTSISSTEGEVCGLASGTAYCWGYNWGGQLGTGAAVNYVMTPQPVVNQP